MSYYNRCCRGVYCCIPRCVEMNNKMQGKGRRYSYEYETLKLIYLSFACRNNIKTLHCLKVPEVLFQ